MDINIQIINSKPIDELFGLCKDLAFDLDFQFAKKWKAEQADRVLVGYLPIYFPREIVHAVEGLAVGIMGTGDRKQIIKGDAFYQSYICHIPRGIIELALDGNLDHFDGFVFPSICDVIRNLSGMFRILGKGSFVKYIDYPQNFHNHIGGTFYQNELNIIIDKITRLNNVKLTPEKLNHSIQLFNTNRRLIEEIYNVRQRFPWRLSAEDLYHIIRAGHVLPVEMHNAVLKRICDYVSNNIGEPMDKIKVIITGAFCEQPPIGLIKTIEIAGCYIVDDDFSLGSRWIEGDVDCNTDEPVKALVDAYLTKSRFSPSVYNITDKGEQLASLAKKRNADGIIFAAPSFCDPALLDQPILQKTCDENNLRYISFQYSENTGQFKVIKEQVGAFSDSIKLWEETPAGV
jgi:benzoyl-CoA reductase subunit C